MAAKKSFLLRINPDLYEALEHWAADEIRSVNAHIEFLLREATRRAGRLGAAKARPAEEEEERTDQRPGEE
ncbi:MAG: toxin-antitoxin system HicB family antitoxin [Firmicutes bacterium]|nr:toxin-antitoxin system HicB family antitoxin [Bacillota bacterium]